MRDAIARDSPLLRAQVEGRCRRGICSAVFHGRHFDSAGLFDLDRLGGTTEGHICDYLWLGRRKSDERQWVVAIEFKNGYFHAPDVVAQLAGGARLAESEVAIQDRVCFCPALVFGGGAHKRELEYFRDKSVRFGEKSWPVQVVSTKILFPNPSGRCSGVKHSEHLWRKLQALPV